MDSLCARPLQIAARGICHYYHVKRGLVSDRQLQGGGIQAVIRLTDVR